MKVLRSSKVSVVESAAVHMQHGPNVAESNVSVKVNAEVQS